jgi:hypothetical protein
VEKSPPGLLKPAFLIGNAAKEDIPWSQQSPTTQDFTCREEDQHFTKCWTLGLCTCPYLMKNLLKLETTQICKLINGLLLSVESMSVLIGCCRDSQVCDC